jgi:putative endonuclease
MASTTGTLYVGVTSNLPRRVWQHKHHAVGGFTDRYGVDTLVYVEEYPGILDAIRREKRIKGWRRKRKLQLVRSANPHMKDLGEGLLAV